MSKSKLNSYRFKQFELRDRAITWQQKFEQKNYSCFELMELEQYWRKQAKRYGLIKEFKENGII